MGLYFVDSLIGDSTIDNHWKDYIEISVHHYCKLLLRRGIISHGPVHQPTRRRVLFIAWTMHLCRALCRCALGPSRQFADAPHTPTLPEMDYSAADGNDLCSSKIAVVGIISGIDALILPAARRRHFTTSPVTTLSFTSELLTAKHHWLGATRCSRLERTVEPVWVFYFCVD